MREKNFNELECSGYLRLNRHCPRAQLRVEAWLHLEESPHLTPEGVESIVKLDMQTNSLLCYESITRQVMGSNQESRK